MSTEYWLSHMDTSLAIVAGISLFSAGILVKLTFCLLRIEKLLKAECNRKELAKK